MQSERLPMPVDGSALWSSARDILHFVGVCGAGKTTLTNRLAARCTAHGGKAIGTLDWDSHTAYGARQSERAFSREFDRISNEGSDPAIHDKIVQHSLSLIDAWKRSDANVVLVDRWYESYDNFPQQCATQIQNALAESGFKVTVVNLVIAAPQADGGDFAAMCARLAHTKANRPESWWTAGMGTLEDMARTECAYQDDYRAFCSRSPFSGIRMPTTDMDWDDLEETIVNSLKFAARWRNFSTNDAKSILATVLQ